MSVDLAASVRAAGVVGAGGAGFPSHVKVASRVEVVIANGAECEPMLCTDQVAMLRDTARILEGLRLVKESTGASRVVLATKGVYADVVAAWKKALAGARDIELFQLDNFYPSGDEQVLTHEVTGRVIPEGGLPLDVGVLVQNVCTLANIAESTRGVPVTRRLVSVSGAVRHPGVWDVPLGTPAARLVQAAGGPGEEPVIIIDGGPMMGRVLRSPDEPVKKTTSGFLVVPANHELSLRLQQPWSTIHHRGTNCCHCRRCTDLCPRWLLGHSLEPHKIMRTLALGGEATPEQLSLAYLCCLCNVCETFSCPLDLSPRRVYEAAKGKLAAAGFKNPHRLRPEQPREEQAWSKLPKPRLIERLGLSEYESHFHYEGTLDDVKRVSLPLKQHVGAPAKPVVCVGDSVGVGQLVAEIPENALGARLHASIAGRVVEASKDRICIER